jgi:putative FmdB family regulatory protein
MPKYFYSCQECEHSFGAYHGTKERLKNCPQCDTIDGLVRKVNKVFIKNENTNELKQVGDLTKEFIEVNREVLKGYRKELGNNEYNDNNSSD